MKEEWRDVKGFESLYKVSNYGLVKRNSDGYIVPVHYRNEQPILNLTKNKKQWCRSLHHLVAEAFIENHLNCKYVIHLDRDRTNNRVDNLMWACTEKKIFGVGINDIGFTYDSNGKKCASYMAWSSMLQRCYQEQSLKKRPRYRGCSVCQEWLLYSNFKKWFESQENEYKDGYGVDKDIIKKGNTAPSLVSHGRSSSLPSHGCSTVRCWASHSWYWQASSYGYSPSRVKIN